MTEKALAVFKSVNVESCRSNAALIEAREVMGL
jgi:hypothetical protein